MNRIVMIGWDGATFDLIPPGSAEGKLPTIARLMAAGVHGPLRSTMPPWTFPAWTSFMTGKNPGKHGIFDFFRPRPGTYDLEFVNGGHRRGATFWKILGDAGRKVVSISMPCTFPPEPVNGVMISGFDFPGEGPGSYVDARGMYPPELLRRAEPRGRPATRSTSPIMQARSTGGSFERRPEARDDPRRSPPPPSTCMSRSPGIAS